MNMETIIAQRKVINYMKKNDFHPDDIPVSKALLQNAKQAYPRYKQALGDKKKHENKTDETLAIENEIANLTSRKLQLKNAIAEYAKEADKYALEAEQKRNLELLNYRTI